MMISLAQRINGSGPPDNPDFIRSRKVAVSTEGVLYMLTDTLLSPGENGSVQ